VNVTTAISRVRRLIDDRDANPLVSDADIRESLVVACEEVWQMVVASGANIYTQTVDVTSNVNGLVDMQALLPLRISNVALVSGNATITLPAARPGDTVANVATSQTLRISYLPRVVFPEVGEEGDPIAWATESIPSNTLDQMLCVVAACDVWIITGEPLNKALVARKEELLTSLKELPNIPQHSVIPVGGRAARAPFAWTRGAQPNSIQLVY